jgi:hypothetical protein
MTYHLTFSHCLHITEDESGLLLPITVSTGGQQLKIESYFDSGAKYSVFPRWVGDKLGLNIEAGEEVFLKTGAGLMPAYLHYLTLGIGNLAFDDAPVCIAKYADFDRCLLGRGGWFPSVRMGLVGYDEHFFLSHYDDVNEAQT